MAKISGSPEHGSLTNLVIRASAGTGKTYQLSNRYLALLEQGVPADRILATTFTRKAAGEILERIVLRLAKATQNEAERKQLRDALACQQLSRQRCFELLQGLLRNLHRLRICTLDSLFGQMARAFSLEIGLPAGWKIIDELEEATLRDAAIAAVLRQESTSELVRLTHLLAKGETRRGVGQLVRETVQDLHGLFQETELAAWHTIPKPPSLSAEEVTRLVEALRQLPLESKSRSARDKDCDRAAAGEWEDFLVGGIANKVLGGETTYSRQPLPDEAVDLYRQLLDQARAVLMTRMAFQTEGSCELLHKYDTVRQQLLADHGGLRFDDITRQLDLAMRKASPGHSPTDILAEASAGQLPFRLDGQISHLLLDEFQDTSPRQWRVLRPFVERASRDDGESSFFCVGDVKQAIYGWRGGVAELFDAVEQQVPRLQHQGLTTSFRSSQAVIDTVNRVFSNLHRHPGLDQAEEALKKWRGQFELHSTARTELPGYACLKTAAAPMADQSSQAAVEEAAADLIQELIAAAPSCVVGVLVRKNATVAAMINTLRRRGIGASEEGGSSLTDSAAVHLILSLLRLGEHPGDTVARFHVATSPLGPVVALSDHNDHLAARRVSSRVRATLTADGYGPTIERWAAALNDEVSTRDRTRLRQLVEMAYLYQSHATLRADDFVRHVEVKRVADPSLAAVRVMTVHQSKGLEFDVVVVPELDFSLTGQTPAFVADRTQPTAPAARVCRFANAQLRQLLPADLQRPFTAHANQEFAESLCVLYVALTRAARSLYMVIAPSKDNEKSMPRTFAGMLRSALTDGKAAPAHSVLFECGDPHWLRSLASPRPSSETGTVSPEATPRPIPALRAKKLLASTRHRRSGLERVSPSSLEGGGQVRLARDLEIRGGEAALRGSVMHVWFQQVSWLEDGVPSDGELRALGEDDLRESGGTADFEAWLRDFHAMLDQRTISNQLRRSAYPAYSSLQLRVQTERSFAIRENDRLLTGSMDRLVLAYDRDRAVFAEVLDFKTDQLAANDTTGLQARVEFYRPQLEAYRRAVGALTGLPATRVGARLLFVTLGRVIDLK